MYRNSIHGKDHSHPAFSICSTTAHPSGVIPIPASDRQYNIWLRDPLAINVFTREMAAQKLDYMHLNPCNHIGLYVPVRPIIGFHQPAILAAVLLFYPVVLS